jgi:hypothetical protein
MRPFRLLSKHPLVLLAVVAVAFVGWIWRDALPQRDPAASGGPSVRRAVPQPFDDSLTVADVLVADVNELRLPPDAAHNISKLRTGMTRAEVEKLVGAPAPDRVSAAVVSDGRVTYHAIYEADLGPPATVRPIAETRRVTNKRFLPVPLSPAADRTLVTLEFDATKPGHPLLGIHYSDPLF